MNMAMTSLFTRLISGAASGFSAPFGWLLMQKPLRYMEKDALGRHPKAGVRHNQWLDEIAAGFDGRQGQTVCDLAPCARGANGGYLLPSPALPVC